MLEGDRRPGDPPILVGSSEKARQILGWHPQYSQAKTIIEHAWAWHQQRHGNEAFAKLKRMVSFLALLPRSLTTFLYAVAALLRFYGQLNTTPLQLIPLTILQWSFLAFALGTAALVVNLGLEWNAGNRSRAQAEDERLRAEEERRRARERETQRDDFANEERNKADRERYRAASRAQIQNRFFLLQTRHQLAPGPDTQAALVDFLSFLQEYGE